MYPNKATKSGAAKIKIATDEICEFVASNASHTELHKLPARTSPGAVPVEKLRCQLV